MVRRYSSLRQEGAADDTRHGVAGAQDGDPLELVVRGHAIAEAPPRIVGVRRLLKRARWS